MLAAVAITVTAIARMERTTISRRKSKTSLLLVSLNSSKISELLDLCVEVSLRCLMFLLSKIDNTVQYSLFQRFDFRITFSQRPRPVASFGGSSPRYVCSQTQTIEVRGLSNSEVRSHSIIREPDEAKPVAAVSQRCCPEASPTAGQG